MNGPSIVVSMTTGKSQTDQKTVRQKQWRLAVNQGTLVGSLENIHRQSDQNPLAREAVCRLELCTWAQPALRQLAPKMPPGTALSIFAQ